MKRPTNSEIVGGYNEKEHSAFNLIFEDCRTAIFELASRILKNDADAQDLTHDMYFKLRENTTRESSIKEIYNVVMLSTKNLALDWLRKQRTNRKYVSEQLYLQNEITEAEMFRMETGAALYYEVDRCRQKLTPQAERVFDMYFTDEKKIPEIAKELNIETKTVSNLKSDAMKVMRFEIVPRKPFIFIFILNILP